MIKTRSPTSASITTVVLLVVGPQTNPPRPAAQARKPLSETVIK